MHYLNLALVIVCTVFDEFQVIYTNFLLHYFNYKTFHYSQLFYFVSSVFREDGFSFLKSLLILQFIIFGSKIDNYQLLTIMKMFNTPYV